VTDPLTISTLTVAPEALPASGTAPCAELPLFYLGTHHPNWLDLGVPLFISDRRLRGYRRLPRARSVWALDSGGFTELSRYGAWQRGPSPAQYAARVRRYRDEIGHLAWAAPQDWMCEPIVIHGGAVGGQRFAGTGLSVAEHQARTVANYLELRSLAPELPFVPVLQGWSVGVGDDHEQDRLVADGVPEDEPGPDQALDRLPAHLDDHLAPALIGLEGELFGAGQAGALLALRPRCPGRRGGGSSKMAALRLMRETTWVRGSSRPASGA
jgi:hypothetical protein